MLSIYVFDHSGSVSKPRYAYEKNYRPPEGMNIVRALLVYLSTPYLVVHFFTTSSQCLKIGFLYLISFCGPLNFYKTISPGFVQNRLRGPFDFVYLLQVPNDATAKQSFDLLPGIISTPKSVSPHLKHPSLIMVWVICYLANNITLVIR